MVTYEERKQSYEENYGKEYYFSLSRFVPPRFDTLYIYTKGFSGGSTIKNLPANAGDAGFVGLIPGLGRSPGKRNGNPLQYSCLENPMDRGAWRAVVHGVTKSRTQLSTQTHSKENNTFISSKIMYGGDKGK